VKAAIKERIELMRHCITPEDYIKTPLGVMPKSWKQYKIMEIFTRVGIPVLIEPEKEYVQIGIRSHCKGLFYKESVLGKELGNKAVFWIEPDCFIVNIVFAWEQAIGKTTIKEVGLIGSHRFPMYRPLKGRVDLDYILQFFMTIRGKAILEEASPGGAGRNKTLGQERFAKSLLILPSFTEQQKIVKILNHCDAVISLKQQLVEEECKRKKWLLRNLLDPDSEVRLPGFDNAWSKVKVGELCAVRGGGTPSTAVAAFWKGNIAWLSSSDIIDGDIYHVYPTRYITEEAIASSAAQLCPKNSIAIVTRVGVGKLAVTSFPLCTSQDFTNLCEVKCNTIFLALQLQEIVLRMKLSAQGTSIRGVTVSEVKSIRIWLPSANEQTAIATTCITQDKKISLLEQELSQWRQKKKALMQLLLTGLVRVEI